MWEEPTLKVFFMYKWGVFIAKGKTSPCDCSTSLMIIWLTWLFNFTCGSLGLPHYIILITTVWPTVVMWPRWLMTWLDTTMLVCSCYWWCPCQAVVLLSVDVILVYHSFIFAWQGVWSLWWSWCLIYVCTCMFLFCLYFDMLHVFVCSQNKSPRMHSLFIHSWTNLLACSPCSSRSSSHHVSSMYLYLQSLMTKWQGSKIVQA